MIVDTSAIVCLLQNEPDKPLFEDELFAAQTKQMSAGTLVELAAVVSRKKIATEPQLGLFLNLLDIETVAMTAEQAEIAHAAYRRFGIGSGHQARLNFGDCFSYALAKVADRPLLFKGDDFTHTDVKRAI